MNKLGWQWEWLDDEQQVGHWLNLVFIHMIDLVFIHLVLIFRDRISWHRVSVYSRRSFVSSGASLAIVGFWSDWLPFGTGREGRSEGPSDDEYLSMQATNVSPAENSFLPMSVNTLSKVRP